MSRIYHDEISDMSEEEENEQNQQQVLAVDNDEIVYSPIQSQLPMAAAAAPTVVGAGDADDEIVDYDGYDDDDDDDDDDNESAANSIVYMPPATRRRPSVQSDASGQQSVQGSRVGPDGTQGYASNRQTPSPYW
jgi:hypothetical protein